MKLLRKSLIAVVALCPALALVGCDSGQADIPLAKGLKPPSDQNAVKANPKAPKGSSPDVLPEPKPAK